MDSRGAGGWGRAGRALACAGTVGLLGLACGSVPKSEPVDTGPCHEACLQIYPALVGSDVIDMTVDGQFICACWYTEVGTTLIPAPKR